MGQYAGVSIIKAYRLLEEDGKICLACSEDAQEMAKEPVHYRDLAPQERCCWCGWRLAGPRPSKKGRWVQYDIRRAFVAGAQWWEWESRGATMWQSDRNKAEAEATKRYGTSSRPPGGGGA